MNRTIRIMVLGAAVLGLGLSMPSCPGQQAVQQQIDAMQKTNDELRQKVESHENAVRVINEEMTQIKNVLGAMNGVIQSEKLAIEKLTSDVSALSAARGSSRAAKPAAPAKTQAPTKTTKPTKKRTP